MRGVLAKLVAVISALAVAFPAAAGGLIRDAEVEHTLRLEANPVFEAAGLKPSAVRIFIVQDNAINAFVAGGQNVFLHTGLLMAMENPGMLMGVVAHETGHITGGHLARGSEKLKNAQIGSILGFVLGIAVGAAGGGNVGAAVIGSSQSMVQRNLLAYSRANEQAADEAALSVLDRLHISASGMLNTFELLRRNEMRSFGAPDPYMLTHPLSKERIEVVRSHVETSSIPEDAYPTELDGWHQRMRAKLYAFLELPPKVFARYPETDKSVPARMARAVAWYKMPELTKALAEMDALQKILPNDPFVWDLRGQILFEHGQVKDARAAYSKAVALRPDDPLLLTSLAEIELAERDRALASSARAHLERANTFDNTNAHTWHLLAGAYGTLGEPARAKLALAEEALLNNNPDQAMALAKQAVAGLPKDSPAALRADDVQRQAARMKEDAPKEEEQKEE